MWQRFAHRDSHVVGLDGVIYLANWIVGFRPFLGAFDRAMTQLFARVSPAAESHRCSKLSLSHRV